MRVFLRILSILLAAALLLLGILVVVEVVLAALDRPSWLLPYSSLASTLRDNTWDSDFTRVVAGILCAIGLLLLLLALRRGAPSELALSPMTDGVQTSVHRRGLQNALKSAATRVDGISGADVSVGRRSAQVNATSALKDPGPLPSQIEANVQQALDEVSLAKPMKVSVSTKARS